MLIALQCCDRKVVQEADNYYHLRAQCAATFLPYVRRGNDVDLCYSIPVSYLKANATSPNRQRAASYVEPSSHTSDNMDEECVVAYVRCPASFDTFLHVWEECLRPLQLLHQEHVLPTLYVVQGAPLEIPEGPSLGSRSSADISPKRAKAVPTRARTPSDRSKSPIVMANIHTTPQARRQMKAALPLRGMDADTLDGVQPATTNTGGFTPEAHANTPNAIKAKALLASFVPSSAQVVPVIRAIMRCGEASVLVPFNARRPPSQGQLLESVKASMLAKLRATEAELVANSPSRQRDGNSSVNRNEERLQEAALAALNITNPSEVIFVLSMFLPKSAAQGCDAIDVDDDDDVALLAEATLEAGNDFSTYLIVESHERSDPSLLALPNSFFFGDLVPHSAPLTFNRASSPVRNHVILDVDEDDE